MGDKLPYVWAVTYCNDQREIVLCHQDTLTANKYA